MKIICQRFHTKTGITKPCTQLHPAHFNLHSSPSTSNFPKFRPKNSKLSILTENWHTWYLGGADSESGFRFLKFQPQNLFLGKIVQKKSKLSVLSENWHTCYLEVADSYSDISFLNFQT